VRSVGQVPVPVRYIGRRGESLLVPSEVEGDSPRVNLEVHPYKNIYAKGGEVNETEAPDLFIRPFRVKLQKLEFDGELL